MSRPGAWAAEAADLLVSSEAEDSAAEGSCSLCASRLDEELDPANAAPSLPNAACLEVCESGRATSGDGHGGPESVPPTMPLGQDLYRVFAALVAASSEENAEGAEMDETALAALADDCALVAMVPHHSSGELAGTRVHVDKVSCVDLVLAQIVGRIGKLLGTRCVELVNSKAWNPSSACLVRHFCMNRRFVASASNESQTLGVSRFLYTKFKVCLAMAAIMCEREVMMKALVNFADGVQASGGALLLLSRHFRYDETPLRFRRSLPMLPVRLQDAGPLKVVQSQFGVAALARTGESQYWLLVFPLTGWLQSLDNTKAVSYLSALRELDFGTAHVASRFRRQQRLATTDGDSAAGASLPPCPMPCTCVRRHPEEDLRVGRLLGHCSDPVVFELELQQFHARLPA